MNISSIAPFVKDQFPDFYASEGPRFIAFLEAYYEWVSNMTNPRSIYSLTDIDSTVDEFILHFKEKYLSGFSLTSTVDLKKIIKASSQLFATKGNEKSLKLFFQLLYGETVNVYYPGDDVIRVSDGQWIEPKYIECNPSPIAQSLIGERIVGSVSKAIADVENCVRRTINEKIVDVFYVSHQDGTFIRGERISKPNQLISNAPIVQGSLIGIDIDDGGSEFNVGDTLEVESEFGIGGIVRISRLENRTGIISFSILDGGSGYFIDTPVIVSSVNFSVDAVPTTLIDGESVQQNLAQIGYISANGTANLYSMVTGLTSANSVVGTGKIVFANTTNIVVDVNTGTFADADIVNTVDFQAVTSSFADITANANLVGANSTNDTLGVHNTSSTFFSGGVLRFLSSNTSANIVSIKTGTGANASIGTIFGSVTETFYTDRLNGRNTQNVQFSTIRLDGTNSNVAANGYGFTSLPAANVNTVIGNALSSNTFTSGVISALDGISPGRDYNIGPFVRVYNEITYPYRQLNTNLRTITITGAIIPNEVVVQTIVNPGQIIGYTNASGSISVGDVLRQTSTNAIASVVSINATSIVTKIENANLFSVGAISIPKPNVTANIVSVANTTSNSEWKAIVVSQSQNLLTIKPLSVTTRFTPEFPLVGQTTGATVFAVGDTYANTQVLGNNAIISTRAVATNGSIAEIEVINSGFSFPPFESVVLRANSSSIVAAGEVIVNDTGKAEGFFADDTGFLDQQGAIHDNQYYQAYSYELQTGLSFSAYKDVLLKTFHKAGFAVFGSVVKTVNIPAGVSHDTTALTLV